MKTTITIEGVDEALLEKQRLALVRVTNAADHGKRAKESDIELIDGLQNMLDTWSDERHRRDVHILDEHYKAHPRP